MRVGTAESSRILGKPRGQILVEIRIDPFPIVIDAEMHEIRRKAPIVCKFALCSHAHLKRVWSANVGPERLDALDAHRRLAGKELLRRVAERVWRLQKIDGIRGRRRK